MEVLAEKQQAAVKFLNEWRSTGRPVGRTGRPVLGDQRVWFWGPDVRWGRTGRPVHLEVLSAPDLSRSLFRFKPKNQFQTPFSPSKTWRERKEEGEVGIEGGEFNSSSVSPSKLPILLNFSSISLFLDQLVIRVGLLTLGFIFPISLGILGVLLSIGDCEYSFTLVLELSW